VCRSRVSYLLFLTCLLLWQFAMTFSKHWGKHLRPLHTNIWGDDPRCLRPWSGLGRYTILNRRQGIIGCALAFTSRAFDFTEAINQCCGSIARNICQYPFNICIYECSYLHMMMSFTSLTVFNEKMLLACLSGVDVNEATNDTRYCMPVITTAEHLPGWTTWTDS